MSANSPFPSQVRVLVVDDSAFMRTTLTRMISSELDFQVVGTASVGPDALAKIAALGPDLVTLDVATPNSIGLETLRGIMRRFPRPVIIVSDATAETNELALKAFTSGAFDYVSKNRSPTSLEISHIRSDLIDKLRSAAKTLSPRPGLSIRKPPAAAKTHDAPSVSCLPEIIAIGASTGGPKALQQILPRFPRDFSLPILIVQHMPSGFTAAFARRLNSLASIRVREATQHECIQPGIAYICPSGVHMRVQPEVSGTPRIISLDPQPLDALHIPSVDVLMHSVAEVYRNRALGIILTGMGSDGANGMKAIYQQGGFTIGQDQASCTVYGMPKACADLGILSRILPLAEIPDLILQVTRWRKPA